MADIEVIKDVILYIYKNNNIFGLHNIDIP